MRVPSWVPAGKHRIRTSWKGLGRNLERVFTFSVDNPNYGKLLPDPHAVKALADNPKLKAVVLQQGRPCPELGLKEYAGCTDAFIASARGNATEAKKNYGGKDHLWVGPYAREHRTLIRYDLSALPKNVVIRSALLRIFAYSGGPHGVSPYRVLKPWSAGRGGEDTELRDGRATNGQDWQHLGRTAKAGECSWVTSAEPTAWSEPGCGKAGEDHAPEPLSNATYNAKESEARSRKETRYWVTWDVTKAAADWLLHPEKNHGLLLKRREKKGGGRYFSSDYHDVVYRPKLVIIYEAK